MCGIDVAVLAAAHDEFLARAENSAFYRWPELSAYVGANDIDLRHLARLNIGFSLMPVAFFGDRFDFVDEDERDAELGAVVEAVAADVKTVIDFVAWSPDNPAKFATLLGIADALGEEHVENPATYFGGQALRVWRTPLGWLQSQCRGVAILNPASTPRWLAAAPGLIAAEDIDHAREIGRLLHPYGDPRRIGFLRRRSGGVHV